MEAKGTNKLGKGTLHESKQLLRNLDLPELRLLEKRWSDGHKHTRGLYFSGGCIKLSCRLYMGDLCAFTDIFIGAWRFVVPSCLP